MSQVHAQTDGAMLRLSLAGALTIAEVAETRGDLLARLATAPAEIGEVALDLSAVPEIDTAGVQLLLSTAHTLSAQGKRATLLRQAEVVRTVAQALGAADASQSCGFLLRSDTGATT